jgi:hypothetical protein
VRGQLGWRWGHGTLRIVLSALVIAVLAVLAAGCGGGSDQHAAAPATTATPPPKTCTLSAAQKRALARSRRDIHLLQQVEKPLHTFSERGTPAQERLTGKFLLDSGNLPALTRGHLIHLAKSAVGLCGLCFQGLEAEEPALAGKLGRSPCGS